MSRQGISGRMGGVRERGFQPPSEEEESGLGGRAVGTGNGFRNFFYGIVILAVVLLGLSKYDMEYNVEVPQVETGEGFGEVSSPFSSSDGGQASVPFGTPEELEAYYEELGVEGRLNLHAKGSAAHNHSSLNGKASDPDKDRRRENYRVRQEIKRAFHEHQEKQGQLVHCGRSCEAKNKQVELAYSRLASQVDRELFGVLLDAEDTKSVRSTTPKQLKSKYEEKREKILQEEENEEDRNMALEELKDAYDIIENPEARRYYLLYGAKPPEQMRHVSARHGGWGQEMALGTFKYRIIIMWLDFLHRHIGVWGETAVLLSVVFFVLARLPKALQDSERILNEFAPVEDEPAPAAATAE